VYTDTLDGRVKWEADSLIRRLIERLAEYVWLHYPDAHVVSIGLNPDTGHSEPILIEGTGGQVLWQVDGPGWEPGGSNGPLFSLAPQDAADRHGARIHHDISLLGLLLPEGSQWISEAPGQATRSSVNGADWDICFPSSTDRLQYLAEVKLDKEAEA
jgi:hypothetical protein